MAIKTCTLLLKQWALSCKQWVEVWAGDREREVFFTIQYIFFLGASVAFIRHRQEFAMVISVVPSAFLYYALLPAFLPPLTPPPPPPLLHLCKEQNQKPKVYQVVVLTYYVLVYFDVMTLSTPNTIAARPNRDMLHPAHSSMHRDLCRATSISLRAAARRHIPGRMNMTKFTPNALT